MTPGAAVEADGSWRRLRGHLLGLAQPSLHGQLRVVELQPQQLAAIDVSLVPLLGALPAACADARGAAAVAHRVLHWTCAVQRLLGLAVSARYHLGPATAALDGSRHFAAALPQADASACAQALSFVCQSINRCVATPSRANELDAALALLRQALQLPAGVGQNTPYLLLAALDLDVPVQRVTASVVRLGWGCQQRMFASTFSDRTPALGANLAADKVTTAMLLRQAGLPGAVNQAVADAAQAVAVAQRLGYPVVVKPRSLDRGLGVAADLADDAAVRTAYAAAAALSPAVVVERHVAGTGHRLTVAHGRVIKATAKRNWGVVGDGSASVAALVRADIAARQAKAAAPSPSATASREPPLPAGTWSLDDEALGLLAQYGLYADSVPAAGQFVALRRRNNATAGGSTERLELATVHPDNLALAVRAAEVLMLDLAGIDLILADITQSWATQEALICEVNAKPQTDAKTMATIVGEALAHGDGRIPVALLVLGDGAAGPDEAQAQELMQLLGAADLAGAAGVWLQRHRLTALATDAWGASAIALASRRASHLALVMQLDDVLQHGLPVDRLVSVAAAPDLPALLQWVRDGAVGDAMPPGAVPRVAPGWSDAQAQRLRALLQMVRPHMASRAEGPLQVGESDVGGAGAGINPSSLRLTK